METSRPQPTDAPEYDVIVIGSGAGGLSAALTASAHGLSVLVLEKEPLIGGTTARSGGVLWIPNNPVSVAAGINDSTAAAQTYLQEETGNRFDAERVGAYLVEGPKMVAFMQANTDVRFVALPQFADYHPDKPGGIEGGRSIVAEPLDGRRLGKRIHLLRPPLREITFVGMMFSGSQIELRHFFQATRSLTSLKFVVKRLARHGWELLRHGRAMNLASGNALAGRLALSAFHRGIEIRLSTPAVGLVKTQGRVSGVEVQTQTGVQTIGARRGVVLAAGGFPHGEALRRQYFPHVRQGGEHLSPGAPGSTGDGLRLAQSAGGRLSADLAEAAAWIPVSRVKRRAGGAGVFPHLVDRCKPGIIAVNHNAIRFVNEADSYHDFGQAMLRFCDPEAPRAFLICDHRTLRKYGLGYAKPFPVPITHHLWSGYLRKGRTIAELASRLGLDAKTLQQTIAAYNDAARQGEDPEFGKGSSAYNRYLGDPEHGPNPCVAPVEQAPFYAVEVILGDLGTFVGVATDGSARVLDEHNLPIEGLYSVGNDSASMMGGQYPGAGITLGPAMTFGYVAGKHLTGAR